MTGVQLTSNVVSGTPIPDELGASHGVVYRGGSLKVVRGEFGLNALDGYLIPNSTADQSAGMQAFCNAVLGPPYTTGQQGYIPPGIYHMGNTPITDNGGLNGDGHIQGAAGGNWMDARQSPSGTILQWDSDVSAPPDTVCGIDSAVGPGVRFSHLCLVGPNTYGAAYGVRPASLGGIRSSGGTVDHLSIRGFGAAVVLGGAGHFGDHQAPSYIGVTGCGFGIACISGQLTGGDDHFDHIKIGDATLAAIMSQNTAEVLIGGSMSQSGLYGPYGFMRWVDSGASATLWLADFNFNGVNIEAPGNGHIFDEAWNSGSNGGAVQGCEFGQGMMSEVPGPAFGRTWKTTAAVTAQSGSQLTVTVPAGFVLRNYMTAVGTNIPAGTTMTVVSGTWPATSYVIALSATPTGSVTSVLLTMPILGTCVSQSIDCCHFGGTVPSSTGGVYTFPYLAGKYISNNYAELGQYWRNYVAQTPLVNAGAYCSGNGWGRGDGAATKMTTCAVYNNSTIGQFDVVEYVPGSATQGVRPATGNGIVAGIAQQASTGGVPLSVDLIVQYVSGTSTVRNKGASAITSGTWLKVDAANPGGVIAATGPADGPIVGVAVGAIAATSTGQANICGARI